MVFQRCPNDYDEDGAEEDDSCAGESGKPGWLLVTTPCLVLLWASCPVSPGGRLLSRADMLQVGGLRVDQLFGGASVVGRAERRGLHQYVLHGGRVKVRIAELGWRLVPFAIIMIELGRGSEDALSTVC